MAYRRIHTFVSGRVQGVGYRYSTRDLALQLRLTGWVKNLPDGRVEAVFEGDDPSLQKMLQWCRQGPSGSIVKDVEVYDEPLEGLQSFEIRR